MAALVWIGAGLTLAGLCGIVWSVVAVWRARRGARDEAVLRERMQRILPVNVGALFVSFIGLIMVVVGVILG